MDKKGAKCLKIHTAKADRNKVFMIQWKPGSNSEFVSVGNKHLYCWTMTDQGLKGKKGAMSQVKMPKGKSMGFSSVAWSKTQNGFLAGGSDGKIYKVMGNTPKEIQAAHKKMISCLNVIEGPDCEYVVTGSSDSTVKVFKSTSGQKLKEHMTHQVDATPRSVDYQND